MANIELRNESGLEFTDISSEAYREYSFPSGVLLRIENPAYLNTSPSGGHRLLDEQGTCYYIRVCENWYIEWKAKDGAPHFVK